MKTFSVWSTVEVWGKVNPSFECLRGRLTHHASNDNADAAGDTVDDTIDEGEVEGLSADRADMEVAINAGADEVHKLVVDIGPGGILDLETEGAEMVVEGAVLGMTHWADTRAAPARRADATMLRAIASK